MVATFNCLFRIFNRLNCILNDPGLFCNFQLISNYYILVLECSCQQNCNKTGNCCFPEYHHSNTDDDINDTVVYKKSCLSLVIVSPLDDDFMVNQKYNIITSVKMPSKYARKNPMSEECGHQNIAPWGSFYPAFSKTKNRLYKNIACAILDGSSDAIQFDVYVICERYDLSTIDLDNFVKNGYISNSNKNKCQINFKYLGDSKDLNWHLCFTGHNYSCPAVFTIRTVENVNNTQVDIATECDIEASLTKEVYANVFCHICEDAMDIHGGMSCSYGRGNSRKESSYKILIDTNCISNYKRKYSKKVTAPMACRAVNVRILNILITIFNVKPVLF